MELTEDLEVLISKVKDIAGRDRQNDLELRFSGWWVSSMIVTTTNLSLRKN